MLSYVFQKQRVYAFYVVFIFFFLDIFFIYISNVIPFPSFPSENPLSPFPSPYSPTHPLPLPGPGIPLHRGIELSQDQGSLLPLMIDKAIFCYICSRSHGSLHVYSWAGSLVPGSSKGYWLVHIVVPPMGLQAPSAPLVLSLVPSLGTLCSVQWLAESIHLCICQALAVFNCASFNS